MSKVMRSVRDELVGEMNIVLGGQVLEVVQAFKYLGALMTAEGELRQKYRREFWKGVKYWEW